MSSLVPILLALVFGGAEPCRGGFCDCVTGGSARAARAGSDAVFTGVATAVRDTMLRREDGERFVQKAVTFETRAGWKGVRTRSVTVLTGWGGGDCGYPFERGSTYLVYANRRRMGTTAGLVTGICTRTAALSAARADLAALGRPVYRNPRRSRTTSRT
jgi:hypothetical protein